MFFKRNAVAVERRTHRRIAPPGALRVDHQEPGTALNNAVVLNLSAGGAALRSDEPVKVGERLIFSIDQSHAPVHCEVVDCQEVDGDWYHIRCRCIMGGFDIDEQGSDADDAA